MFQFVISLLLSCQVLVELLDELFLSVNAFVGQVVNFIKWHELFFPDHEVEAFCSLRRVLVLDLLILLFELIVRIELHLFQHGFGHEVFGELESFFFDELILGFDDFLEVKFIVLIEFGFELMFLVFEVLDLVIDLTQLIFGLVVEFAEVDFAFG